MGCVHSKKSSRRDASLVQTCQHTTTRAHYIKKWAVRSSQPVAKWAPNAKESTRSVPLWSRPWHYGMMAWGQCSQSSATRCLLRLLAGWLGSGVWYCTYNWHHAALSENLRTVMVVILIYERYLHFRTELCTWYHFTWCVLFVFFTHQHPAYCCTPSLRAHVLICYHPGGTPRTSNYSTT